MKVVALLPMKANSERVKGKNFRTFCGKPLFRWVLDTLEDIEEIDLIQINTDARNILEENNLFEEKKIKFRDRKEDICGDLVSMNTIINDDVDSIDADIYLMTHTTNPLLSKDSIKKAILKYKDVLKKGQFDSLFTVNKIQDRFYSKDAVALNHNPANLVRTQDLEPWYQENSNLYLFTKDSFKKAKARIGKNPIMLETDPFESIDIDTEYDWDLAEVMVEFYQKKGIL